LGEGKEDQKKSELREILLLLKLRKPGADLK